MGLEDVKKEYEIKFLKNVTNKKAIEERLKTDPANRGEALRHELKGYRRLRVGKCRVVYHVNVIKYLVTVASIKYRKDVYEKKG
ncbi:type II toxin-antitoxin system RelE/ParE family toxin [Wolbachia endosymbiont of Cantharis cryptica]|uniref:type II toxin-antitoxin system RelE family toxin n=1 Tax=Wolbachia endosymbiont of Cantharis cryptica TaxID=3066132 RepID=UPI00376F3E79